MKKFNTFNESLRDKMTPTVSTDFLYQSAMNGWLFNINDAIDKVFKEVAQLIYSRENKSDLLRLFHADEVKKFIEETTHGAVQIVIVANYVAAEVYIKYNMDFDKLTDEQYNELVEKTQKQTK